MKKIFIIVIVIILLLSFGIFFATHTGQNLTHNIKVTTSFYPLYFFSSQIAGNKADIINITPSGAEPHDYEPTAQDLADIETSNMLVLNGGGLEPWGDNIRQNIDANHTLVITAGENLVTQQVTEDGKNIVDPHIWLNPLLAKTMVEKITEGFIKIDPENKTVYRKNSDALQLKLDALDTAYRQGLANCTQKNIVTSHAAFGYLAAAYQLHQVAISGLSPDAEPSGQQLADITALVKKNNIQYIFFESLVSPKLSETIATETGAKTLPLNPIEGLDNQQLAEGQNYFTVMEQNLQNLKTALHCK